MHLNIKKGKRNGYCNVKVKQLRAWTGPEGSRRLRLPHFKTIGKLKVVMSSLSTGRLYSQEIFLVLISVGERGGAAGEALRYKPEGREIDSRWCHRNFSGRTMALESAQSLTEISTKNISWG
jgi:hypothetical protein